MFWPFSADLRVPVSVSSFGKSRSGFSLSKNQLRCNFGTSAKVLCLTAQLVVHRDGALVDRYVAGGARNLEATVLAFQILTGGKCLSKHDAQKLWPQRRTLGSAKRSTHIGHSSGATKFMVPKREPRQKLLSSMCKALT